MLRTTLKNLRARKLRLLTTSIAVLLGVAFMAGTLVLTDTVQRSFDDLFADVNDGTDAVVRGESSQSSTESGEQRARIDASVIETVAAVDGVAAAEGQVQGYAQIVGADGDAIGNVSTGAPTFGASWMQDDGLNAFDLVDGRAPAATTAGAPVEAVIDRGSASSGDLAVGDQTTVLTEAGPVPVTVVGIASFGEADNPGGASFAFFTPDEAQRLISQPGKIDSIGVVAEDGVSQSELVDRIDAVLPAGTEALTGKDITAEAQADARAGLSFFNTFLLSFAVIALFVGSFIIYNTFSILVAQRTKEMALLRALGASRRQVMRSVLLEAAVVGVIASALGLLAGIGVAAGLKALFAGMGIDIPAGSVVIASSTVVISAVAGIGVSLASALFPARRAAKVPPIAAMRDVAVDAAAGSRRRVVSGVVISALGGAALAAGLVGDAGFAIVGLGAGLVFIGVAVLGPVIARPVSSALGAPLRLMGMSGKLARANAMRNPKRTSATASALMIGVALVSLITVMATSVKASINENVDQAFNGDFVVDSGSYGFGGLSPQMAEQLNELPEVEAATGIRVTAAIVDGGSTELLSADPVTVSDLFDLGSIEGSLSDLGATQIAVQRDVAEAEGLSLGDTVPVEFVDTGEQQLTVAAIYEEQQPAGDYFLGLPAFEANVANQLDFQVYINTVDGVSPADAEGAIRTVTDQYPQADLQDVEGYKDAQGAQIDQMLNLVYALLALAIVIALIGIANTLALSIFERTRELGLLRAVGMSKRQLRAAIRGEAIIVALLGTALGLGIGVFFGWAVVTALAGEGITVFAIPGGQLGVVVVLAALAGVAAAVLPARRAARMDVLEAVSAD